VYLERDRGREWRALSISDARLTRRNYLYSLAPERLSTAAAVVAAELKETAHHLVESGDWSGVETIGAALRSPQAASAARRPVGRPRGAPTRAVGPVPSALCGCAAKRPYTWRRCGGRSSRSAAQPLIESMWRLVSS
jgi:hypothetical protein